MQKRKKTEIVYTNKGDKPSRFLVNLNSVVADDGEPLTLDREKSFFSKLKSHKRNKPKNVKQFLTRVNFRKNAVNTMSNIKDLGHEIANAQKIAYSIPKSADTEEKDPKLPKKFTSRHKERIKRLAIFPFFKVFIAIVRKSGLYFYKFCFKIGWLAVFLSRFIILLGAGAVKFIYKRTKRIIVAGYKSVSVFLSLKRVLIGKKSDAGKNFAPDGNDRPGTGSSSAEDLMSKVLPKKADAAQLFFHSWDSSSADLGEDMEEPPPAKLSGLKRFFRVFTFSGIRKFVKNYFNQKKQIAGIEQRDLPDIPRDYEVAEELEFRTRAKDLSFKENLKLAIKPALIFACILIVAALPIKGYSYYKSLNTLRGEVMGISAEAINTMSAAAESIKAQDFEQAKEDFSYAGEKFIQARQEISSISGLLKVLNTIPVNNDIKLVASVELLLEAGRLSAETGNYLSALLFSLSASGELKIKDIIENFDHYGRKAIDNIEKLRIIADRIDPEYLPAEYQGRFIELRSRANIIKGMLNEFIGIIDGIKIFLGFSRDTRYLLVFQNNTELRASGGFIGSYALIDFKNGEIKNMEIPGGGSYDTEAGLYEQIIAPKALHIVNPLWHFWDSNWWPDWPATARKLMWFYERSDGPTVDGVISLTPTVIEKLLKLTGPIDMTEDYGVIINSENFWEITQTFSEQKPKSHPDYRPNPYIASTSEELARKPKKIIGDMMRLMIENIDSLLGREKIIGLISLFEENIRQKHILLYFDNNKLRDMVDRLGWSGRVENTKLDYLQVVNTNIAGGKSDREITEKIIHRSDIASDGSIINTVTIERTHNADKGDAFTGQRNNNWTRIYVPQGSEFIEASGFKPLDESLYEAPDENWLPDPDVDASEGRAVIDIGSGTWIYDEFNKTVFANWSQVDPGETTVIQLKYKLPFKLESAEESEFIDMITKYLNPRQKQLVAYSLMVQKQPGSFGSEFESILSLPLGFKPIWHYPENTEDSGAQNAGWKINSDLTVDRFWAVLAEVE